MLGVRLIRDLWWDLMVRMYRNNEAGGGEVQGRGRDSSPMTEGVNHCRFFISKGSCFPQAIVSGYTAWASTFQERLQI